MDTIRPATPDEAETMSALALRSKAHWGYPPEQMAVFRRELTIAPEQVAASLAHVLERDGRVAGFYTLARAGGDAVELEHLFVDPARLRSGVGAALFRHACDVARRSGFRRLVIWSDPNAAGFYRALGASLEGFVASSIPERNLPILALDLIMCGR